VDTNLQVRSDQSSLSIPIEVTWTAIPGRPFTKKGTALAITRFGSLIEFRHELEPTQQISIHCTGVEREVRAQVLGQVRKVRDGYVYGLSWLDANVNLLDIEAPGMDETRQAVSRQMLECDICQTRETVYLDEIQIEVYKGSRSLALRCKQCAAWTMWKEAGIEAASHPSHRAARSEASSDSRPVPRTQNERKHFRVRFKKFRACIRRLGYLEEVVRVENVSRGGFRFFSPKTYRPGTRIEVAIPYMPDADNIFVPARVVRSRELPRMKKQEYGAAYVSRDEYLIEDQTGISDSDL
jgi:hypothetical protein